MPHIHTAPGQIDFTASVFVVYKDTVLLRMHDKYRLWLVPGGHIELGETPEDAAVREVKEETGLDVTLWTGNRARHADTIGADRYRELIPPMLMNIHRISDTHRHIDLTYFATTETDKVTEPANHEQSGGCLWLTKEALLAHPDVEERIKYYGAQALELLAG